MINVAKTYLPNKKKYQQYVDDIYANGWVTNNGPLVKELEKRLAEYLGVRLRNNLKVSETVSIEMGSVVTKNLPSGISVFGNPAKKLRSLTTGPKR